MTLLEIQPLWRRVFVRLFGIRDLLSDGDIAIYWCGTVYRTEE